MTVRSLTFAALFAAAPLGAQQAAPTAQQLFDAAAAVEAKGDWAAAKTAWERLEVAASRNKRTRAVARLRKGAALYELGQSDAAVEALKAALVDLPAGDTSLQEDRHLAHLMLGRVAEASLDYATAAREYAMAETAIERPESKLTALAGLASVQTFVEPAAAAAALDRADALLTAAKLPAETEAVFARRRAVLALNQRDFRAAQIHAERAVKLAGGMTQRVSLTDVAARGDAALAHLLAGRLDEARKYMAYTGAGRIPGGFAAGAEMKAPTCGGEAGLKPADIAVVEFSIGDDGQVVYAAPVYAAGGPGVALDFARAAREWSWSPEKLKDVPPFFRNRVRVEMRCSTEFERPSITDLLEAELGSWLAGKGAGLPGEDGPAAALAARDRAAVMAAEASGATWLGLIGPAYRLSVNAVVAREEANALARRALAAATANGAPAGARLLLDLQVRNTEGADTWRSGRYRNRLLSLATEPAYAADPRARAAARLMLADAERGEAARPHLALVASDAALPANDPLKVGALIRLASLEHARGNAEAARSAFARSGLSADQCALVDKAPKLLGVGTGGAFPLEAQRWGFEGWVQTEYDITADGRPQNVRAVMAYPPFVFSPAGESVFRTARFEKTFRPDGGLGCGAQSNRVRFQLPGG